MLTPPSLHRFYFDGMARAVFKEERYGQAMFNHLLEVRPDLAEQIRGTENDPFHCCSSTDQQFDRFVAYIEQHWNPKTYTRDEIKKAFWDTFHGYGEIFFTYLGNEKERNECTNYYWKDLESALP